MASIFFVKFTARSGPAVLPGGDSRNDLKVDMLLTGMAIYLGALEPSYKYHVGFVKFIYSF